MGEMVLSRHDLSDGEVRKDAEAALRRAEAAGDAAMAAWAREWARPYLVALDAADAALVQHGGFQPWS